MALAGIGTAVALYPVVKRQNEGVALGFVASRTLEAATIFAGVVSLLSLVTLRQAGAGARCAGHRPGAVAPSTTGRSCSDSPHAGRQRPAAGLPDVPVPPGAPGLPLLGLIGAPLLFASVIAKCFGVYDELSAWSGLARPPDRRVGVLARRLPDRQGLQALPHHRRNDRSRHPARQPRCHRLTIATSSRQQCGGRCPAAAVRTTTPPTSMSFHHHHDSRCPDADGGDDTESDRSEHRSHHSNRPDHHAGKANTMIEVENLSKRYGDKLAVDGLSFVVQPGIVTGFLGPNGSGKSTTMRMIAGLDQPTAGRVTVNGGDYRSAAAPMAELGVLLEAKAVHTGRSARNHLLALAQTNGIRPRRVDEVIDIVGLREVAGKRVGGFSLGMGQRLGVASALLGNPQTVVLDEPVNGLDPEGVRWMRTMLKDLAADGHTVFVSSHLMSEMAQTATRLVVIGRGRLIADTTVDEFVARASNHSVTVRTPEAGPAAGAAARPGHHRHHRRPTRRAGGRRPDRRTHRHHRLAEPAYPSSNSPSNRHPWKKHS